MTANGGFSSLLPFLFPARHAAPRVARRRLPSGGSRTVPAPRRALLRVSGSAFTTLHYDFLPRGERRVGTASLSTSAPPR